MAVATTRRSYEETINRWVFDFYVFRAVDAFRNGDYSSFTQFRNLIEALVVRPICGDCDEMMIKLRFMQFLSRINDGNIPGVSFQNGLIPLESALKIFEDICAEMVVPQKDLERVHISIREMLVIVCIKNEQFEKAADMLHKHFPKGKDSAGKKKLFEDLIKKKCNRHSVITSSSYSEFKQDMLDFIDKLYTLPEPSLDKFLNIGVSGAVQTERVQPSFQSRTVQNTQQTNDQTFREHHSPLKSELNTPARNGPSSSVCMCLSKLKIVYQELAKIFSVSASFSQLKQEVEEEAEQNDEMHLVAQDFNLTLSETPREHCFNEDELNGIEVNERTLEAESNRAELTSSRQSSTVILSEDPLRQNQITQQAVEQEQVCAVSLDALTGIVAQTSSSASVVASYQSSDFNSAASESTNPHVPNSSHENNENSPGAAVSAVTVAQLVMEDDSQPSEMETTDCSQNISPVKAGCSEDNPLSSLPTNSTPVRRTRRPAANRKSIPCEPEPASPEQPTEPEHCSTPSRGASPKPSSSDCTPDKPQKQKTKRHRSDEGSVMNSPHTDKRHQSTFKRWMNMSGVQEEWSDEESLFSASTSRGKGSSSLESHGKRKKWTEEESEWVRKGVALYGEGRWEKIKTLYPFKGRTAVNIKDRWRTMKKLNIV
ncbi:telomeric repeat binding factor a [Hoplias malabaricus]|uniref:telomeric repeat binding factor a n=1 Tax=Hoplias malabaricus TaxID=27720 RepID=UPI00346198EA